MIKKFIILAHISCVRTRFVADRNCVGFAREKAQTMSFVERGFERLGLDRQAVDFSRCVHTRLSFPSPLESFSWRWAGRL